jgi:hypothetical protein
MVGGAKKKVLEPFLLLGQLDGKGLKQRPVVDVRTMRIKVRPCR